MAIGLMGCTSQPEQVQEVNYITLESSQVQEGFVPDWYTMTGTLKTGQEEVVLSPLSAEVLSVEVSQGQVIQEGQVLITLDPKAIDQQLAQAKKSLELAGVALQSARDRYEDALATKDRNKALYEQGALSQVQYEQSVAAATDANVTSASLQYQQAKLSYDQLKDTLEDATIKAKSSGLLTHFTLKKGDTLQAGALIARIIQNDTYEIDLSVAESVVGKLQTQQVVTVDIPVLGSSYEGWITEISPTTGPNSKLFPITLQIEAPQAAKPGMYAKVTFDLSPQEKGLIIPSDAVLSDIEGAFVYVVTGETSVEKRNIQTGFDNGYVIAITQGLSLDDHIIIKGQQFISKDIPIKIVRGDD